MVARVSRDSVLHKQNEALRTVIESSRYSKLSFHSQGIFFRKPGFQKTIIRLLSLALKLRVEKN